MKIEAVAVDLDGTLLDNKAEISQENKEILQTLFKEGVLIILSSGRMTDCVIPYSFKLKIDTPIISYNGAMLRAKESEKRKLIFHKPLQSEYSNKIIDFCNENKFHLNYYLSDKLYCKNDPELKKYAELYSNQTGAVINFVSDLSQFKGREPSKLILITEVSSNPEYNPRFRDELYEYFYSIFNKDLTLMKTNPEYLEFLHREVDKGVALKKLIDYYNINIKNIVSFGDGDNDASMLKVAGIGIAMANASQKAKETADIVAPYTNIQAGVAKMLKKLIN